MINEFNIKQLLLMKNRILMFEQTVLNLDSLLSLTKSLEEILNSLNDNQLKQELTTEWWELELISSVMMDREIEIISEESRNNISCTLKNMKKMIDEAILSAGSNLLDII